MRRGRAETAAAPRQSVQSACPLKALEHAGTALARTAKALYMSRAFGYRFGARSGHSASRAISALRLAVQDTALSRR